jgi:predicted nucleic acid-binding protein
MPERKRRLLDSFALIAFLGKEKGFEKVKSLLDAAADEGKPLLMNEVSVGEVFCITSRKRSPEKAEEFLDRLPALPIRLVPNPFSTVIEAARIKAKYPVSYADAFAAATALLEGAAVVTGDPEFARLRDLVEIDWL